MTTPIERLLDKAGLAPENNIFRSNADELIPKLLEAGLHPGHVLYHDGPQHLAITTEGARQHLNDEQIWALYRRFIKQDWGNIRFQEDIDRNGRNAKRERGILLGIYHAPDGTEVWIQQNHRYAPPTIMLPEER